MPPSKTPRKPSPIQIPSRQSAVRQPIPSTLTTEQVHVFEHAALLYHGYEWQAASDAFAVLSRSIESVEDRTLCLLNVGLIQARLGNCKKAATTLEEAVEINPSFPLTYFIVALLSCEQGDYVEAEANMEKCLNSMDQDEVDYRPMGLNFTLDRTLLLHALREIRNAQPSVKVSKEPRHKAVRMASIPAECIFETPLPLRDAAKIAGTGVRRQSRLHRTSKTAKVSEWMNSLSSAEVEDAEMLSSPYWLHDPLSPSSPLAIYHQGLSDIQEDSKIKSDPPHVSARTDGFGLSSPTDANLSKRRTTWHRRPSTPFTPRNARVESESVRELARFIRESGQKKSVSIHVPKDARGEYESMKELARFAQLYAPERVDSAVVQPFDLDPRFIADLRMERILNRRDELDFANVNGEVVLDEDDRSADGPLHRQGLKVSPDSPSSPYGSRRDRVGHDETDSRSTGILLPSVFDLYAFHNVSDPTEASLKDLKSAACRISLLPDRIVQSDSEQTSSSNKHTGSYAETTLSTPSSSANSLYRGATSFDHRIMARRDALRALEGKADVPIFKNLRSTKTLPATPPTGDTTSSIATVDFFDKVLGKKATK